MVGEVKAIALVSVPKGDRYSDKANVSNFSSFTDTSPSEEFPEDSLDLWAFFSRLCFGSRSLEVCFSSVLRLFFLFSPFTGLDGLDGLKDSSSSESKESLLIFVIKEREPGALDIFC